MRAERGPAPGDADSFGDAAIASLRTAVAELSWLLSRGYPDTASLKLVGDRHALTARQRKAVQRCACSDAARASRQGRRAGSDALQRLTVDIDGFNCIIVTESILSGAPVFRGRDGALRDLASVHGAWRQLAITDRAVQSLGELLVRARAAHVRWWLDRPVSNSGRLRALLLACAERDGQSWDVELVDDPDGVLIENGALVASADARILDQCASWIDLPAMVADGAPAWIIELGSGSAVDSLVEPRQRHT